MRVLLVSSRFPWPPWRGNQLRTVQWLDALADHERLLVCPADRTAEPPREPGLEIRRLRHGGLSSAGGLAATLLGGRPVQEGLYATAPARRSFIQAVDEWRPDVAVIQMVRCGWAADAVRESRQELPLLFDAIDCMALHYQRAAATAHPLARWLLRFEAERCRRRETHLVRAAAVTTAVSGRDLRALGAGSGGMIIPVTGGAEVLRSKESADLPTVLLSGNLGYRPTVEAALWFADRVWPRVREQTPSATWVLAGARPTAVIRRLARRPGIEVHGDVDDLGPFLGRAWVAIAPMASGSGVPIKILEAMAAGVPVVADPWSADGLEDPGAVMVAEGETAWINGLNRLLGHSEEARAQAARGTLAWRSHYEPSRIRFGICEAVETAVSRNRELPEVFPGSTHSD